MELYYCEIREFTNLQGQALLPDARRKKMERYLHPEDRARCLAGGLMLRKALGKRVYELCENAQGKPYLEGGPCFNISHSGEYVILGLSEHELGVDIEKIAPFDGRVARRCYTDKELEWLYEQKEASAFYKLWTAKESLMKATGLGFSLPPESFSVLPAEDGWHTLQGRRWFLKWETLPGHQLCTACAASENVRLIKLGCDQLII